MMRAGRQKGMTAIGWLIVLILVLVFAIILIKLVPVYLDGFKVYQTLESLESDSNARGKSVRELRNMINKRLDINMVNDVSAEDISFSRSQDGTVVEIDYEARRQLFGNMYVVVIFNKSVTVPN